MRGVAFWPAGFVGILVIGAHCGGSTSVGSPDGSSSGSEDGAAGEGGSSGGGSNGGTSGGGTSGGGSGSGSGGATSGGSTSGGSNDAGSGGGSGGSSGSSSSGAGSSSGGGHCLNAGGCDAGNTCCGSACCTTGQLCCLVSGPVPPVDPYYCYTPTSSQPTCPPGCAPKCVSDRNLKRDIEPVDERAVLESVAQLPVSTWSYNHDDPSVRHLGPMAQDLYATFGLGNTDRAYDSVDAHGIAFAAIKALYEEAQEQNARIERLERENEALRNDMRSCSGSSRR